jgi:hypothetical protein
VHRKLTGDLLDVYDRQEPGELEHRARRLADRLGSNALDRQVSEDSAV